METITRMSWVDSEVRRWALFIHHPELREQVISCDQQKHHKVSMTASPSVPWLYITGLKTAILRNFKYAKLGIKRVSNSNPTAEHTDEHR